MKRLFVILFVAVLVVGFAACGGGKTKAQENIIESMIEKQSDGEVDVDIDEDSMIMTGEDGKVVIEGDENSMTITGEDGEVVFEADENSATISGEDGDVVFQGDEDGMPWPGGELPAHVPELKGVTVVGTVDDPSGIKIVFKGCSVDEGEAYINALESAGWEIMTTMDMEGVHIIQAQKGNDMLQFAWEEEDDEPGWIQYMKG